MRKHKISAKRVSKAILRVCANLLCLLGILATGRAVRGADALPLGTKSPNESFSRELSKKFPVVEVLGDKLMGTGTIILYNERPAILTNSHVLEGQKKAAVIAFPNQQKIAPVVFDSPLYDVAVIDIDSVVSRKESRRLAAASVNGFCNSKDSDQKAACLKRTNVNFHTMMLDRHVHAVIVEGDKIRSLDTPANWTVWMEKDFYISGFFDGVMVAPMFLHPGSSGGALLDDDVFVGLITKVSGAAEPTALAIPSNDIQAVLENPPRGTWVKTSDGMLMQVTIDGKKIATGTVTNNVISVGGELGNGGGELGNGGGELGNGGGELGNGAGYSLRIEPYWYLKVKEGDYEMDRQNPRELWWVFVDRMAKTFNPFLERHSNLLIDGKPVSVLDVRTPAPENGHAIFAANMALYNHFRPIANVTTYSPGSGTDELLRSARAQAATPVFKFARLFSVDDNNHFSLLNNDCNTTNGDNSQALRPEFDKQPEMDDPHFASISPPACRFKNRAYRVDETGFNMGTPFRVRQDPRFAADMKYQDEDGKSVELIIDPQVQSIQFIKDGRTQTLAELPAASPTRKSFKDPGSGDRAVVIYDSNNLTAVDMLIIERGKRMIELITCTPGQDCNK